MLARFLRLTAKKAKELWALKREAEKDGARRVARRIHAVLLNYQHYTSGEVARLLDAPRSKVSLWLGQYERYGWEALLEGHRSGRPKELTVAQVSQLELSRGTREEIAQGYGILCAAAPPQTGQGRSGGAGPMATIHLPQAKKKRLSARPRCFSATKPASAKTRPSTRPGRVADTSR